MLLTIATIAVSAVLVLVLGLGGKLMVMKAALEQGY